MAISPDTMEILVKAQRGEITDYMTYRKLARRAKKDTDIELLNRVANDEKEHASVWGKYTNISVKPNKLKVMWFSILSYVMGYTFVIKLMQKFEELSIKAYRELAKDVPEAERLMKEEQEHEEKLIGMLDEERLHYVGAIVLGMNDALVEVTGSIAGFTFALADTKMIAMSGIITGTAATLSLAASNFLAERTSGNPKALKISLYTGVAYLITVTFQILPFLLFPNEMYIEALATMIAMVIVIIMFFNYYVSVAKSLPFWSRFGQMLLISMGVAVVAFGIGLAAKAILGVEI